MLYFALYVLPHKTFFVCTEPGGRGNNTGDIIGAVVGGIFAIVVVEVIIIILVYCCYYKKESSKKGRL